MGTLSSNIRLANPRKAVARRHTPAVLPVSTMGASEPQINEVRKAASHLSLSTGGLARVNLNLFSVKELRGCSIGSRWMVVVGLAFTSEK